MLVYDDIHVVNTVNSSLPYRYDIEEFVVHHNLYPADVFCFLVRELCYVPKECLNYVIRNNLTSDLNIIEKRVLEISVNKA